MDSVILVDTSDNAIGTMEKIEAHRKGLLHRAFSILLFNAQGELLLQKRADGKYHSAGLWTNTCCSHPFPGESVEAAAQRRLKEEMGIECDTRVIYKFIYKTELGEGLTEHELDYVLVGEFNGIPAINKAEVSDWKYIDLDSLADDLKENPLHYTYWFRLIMEDTSRIGLKPAVHRGIAK